MHPARHQAGEMGHVDHEDGAHFVGNCAESGEVDDAGIGRAARQDQLGLVLARQAGHLVHVDLLIVAAHRVGHRLEPFAGIVGGMAVGEMAAGGQVQTHEGVARRKQGIKRRLIGIGAGVRLDIGESGAEQLPRAIDGQLFRHVDIFAAAIVALARIAFGIFVGQHRALGLQHGARDDVLGGDQLDLVALAVQLVLDAAENLRIGGFQPLGEKVRILVHGIGGSRHQKASLQPERIQGPILRPRAGMAGLPLPRHQI